MDNLKIRHVIPKFNGGDVNTWFKQASLAKDLLGIKGMSKIIPLLLEGNAYAVYDQLSNVDKKNESRIAKSPNKCITRFEAYTELRKKMWEPGTSSIPISEVVGVARRLLASARTNVNDECNQYGLIARGAKLRHGNQDRQKPNQSETQEGRCQHNHRPNSRIRRFNTNNKNFNGRKALGLLDTGCTQNHSRTLLFKPFKRRKIHFGKRKLDSFEKWVLKWSKSDSDDVEYRKLVVDQSFREYFTISIIGDGQQLNYLSDCELLCDFSIAGARKGLTSPTLPIVLLSDMFDVIPLEKCQDLFKVVEINVNTWKEDTFFFVPCKNSILRICNDLLRRLSRTQNTIIPLSFHRKKELDDENNEHFLDEDAMEISTSLDSGGIHIDANSKNVNIDYTLYTKFWQLQDFFRNPTQCYEKLKWKTFSTYTKDVLNIFQSYKLDSISGKAQTSQHYFAKFLTNQNLFQLQLGDANFRQYILIQFLILFQYLQSSVKFKSDNQVLNEEQKRWISIETSRIYNLLEETPPNGKQFAQSLWNLFPDNMEACSSEERDFLPSLDEYFSEAIEQFDPANQIEDEYKKVSDGAWGWRALRLLARKSPNFFTYGNKPIARLPDYLESMLKQMTKDDMSKKNDLNKNGHEESNGSGALDGDSHMVESEVDSQE
ncbi:THOC1 [Lepeophtheirus salmonis]|uniref:THOC1 n=1 Tax=Lepeophtheirus salmonis TaxID=72036 RepID=A0A7R8CIB2_LEPSM|nr:THOC1 [Lepeophtheirus salmonis]CAF2830768.1 THOC1 [Lepeophtheirus salmonis]